MAMIEALFIATDTLRILKKSWVLLAALAITLKFAQIFLFDPLSKFPGPVSPIGGHLVRHAPNVLTFDYPKMVPIVYHRVQEFRAKMDAFAKAGGNIDFAEWSQFFTYDVISELTSGGEFGFMEKGKHFHNLVSGLAVGLPLAGLTMRINSLLTKKFIADKVMPRLTDKDGIGAVMGYRNKLLDQRIKLGPVDGRRDILHHTMIAKNPNGTTITLEGWRGSDATAGTLRSIIYRTLQTPGVYGKMIAEIDEAFNSGRISKPVVTYDECLGLPYFCACIKETLRLDPSGPTANPWVINCNKDFYGEDAEIFRSERWIESEERTRQLENACFTFVYGARICLGKSRALMEVHKVILQLVDLDKHGLRVNYANCFQSGKETVNNCSTVVYCKRESVAIGKKWTGE
ncbi:cytochrome P450 [Kalaharituber pfeilii]|nr:cytochrome P450 [Kalaharituber pfeilii]